MVHGYVKVAEGRLGVCGMGLLSMYTRYNFFPSIIRHDVG
jgi:hypothetical protein